MKILMARLLEVVSYVKGRPHDEALTLLVGTVLDSVPIDFTSEILFTVKNDDYEKTKRFGGISEEYAQMEMNLAKSFNELAQKNMERFKTPEVLEAAIAQAREEMSKR